MATLSLFSIWTLGKVCVVCAKMWTLQHKMSIPRCNDWWAGRWGSHTTRLSHAAHTPPPQLIPATCCAVLQGLFLPLPHLPAFWGCSIKSGRDALENWPFIFTVSWGRRGREGQCRNTVRLNWSEMHRVQAWKSTNWQVNHLYVIYSCLWDEGPTGEIHGHAGRKEHTKAASTDL